MGRRALSLNPRLSRILREHWQSLTLSFFVGFGLVACSGGDEPQEPVQAEAAETQAAEDGDAAAAAADGETGAPAASPEGDDEGVEMPAEGPDEGLDEAAPEMDESALVPSAPPPSSMAVEDEAPMLPEESSSELALAMPPPVAPAPMAPAKPAKQHHHTASKKKHKHHGGHDSWSGHDVPKAKAKGQTSVYVVQAGDTLARIAQKIYGGPSHWQRLAAVNGLAHPFRIFPGDGLTFEASNEQAKEFAEVISQLPSKTVTVRRGDTLSSIAHRIYGNSNAWKQLMAFNKSKINNPHRISVGMTISYMDPEQLAQVFKGMISAGSGKKATASKAPAMEEDVQVEVEDDQDVAEDASGPETEAAPTATAAAPAAKTAAPAAKTAAATAPASDDQQAAADDQAATAASATATEPATVNQASPDAEFEEEAPDTEE